MLQLLYDPKMGVWAEDAETKDKLRRNYFGKERGGRVFLHPEEALYLLSCQQARCLLRGQPLGFDALASQFPDARLMVKFNAYRDWRDRGLVLERFRPVSGERQAMKKYPSAAVRLPRLQATVHWHADSFSGIIEDPAIGKQLFNDHWIGQLGVYKQDRGSLLVLDFMEVLLLEKHCGAQVVDAKTRQQLHWQEILKDVVKAREYARQLYTVYEDWRLRGYVVKTGFKFGAHFRIYFPGASPAKGGQWVHSRHVLHVFPKDQKLLISEWARAVRVAHGVKKTFLLAIPELQEDEYLDYPADFLAYLRKKEGKDLVRETPEGKPRFLLAAVGEDEHIGGLELASLLRKAGNMGLVLSISDRETAVTYYLLKKIDLPEARYSYYEIEWMKP